MRDSSVSALTRPRCSSSSGRSSCAIRRTSSSACRTASLVSSTRRRRLVGIGLRERVELEQHAGQHLADLVVEAARDAQPLGLLRGEGAAAALAPLGLEPVEHLVERVDDLDDLDAALLGQALPGPEQVDRAHPLDEPVDRRRASGAAAAGSRRASTTSPTTTSSVSTTAIEAWMRPGESTSTSVPTSSSPALIAKTRQSSGSREKRIAQDSRVSSSGRRPVRPAPAAARCALRVAGGAISTGTDGRGLELAGERAAQLPAARAARARAEDDHVRALLGRDLREPVDAVPAHDPRLDRVADARGDRLQHLLDPASGDRSVSSCSTCRVPATTCTSTSRSPSRAASAAASCAAARPSGVSVTPQTIVPCIAHSGSPRRRPRGAMGRADPISVPREWALDPMAAAAATGRLLGACGSATPRGPRRRKEER